jgi:hypothetical protein
MNPLTIDRRKLLRYSALAGGALALPPFLRGSSVSSSQRFDLTTGSTLFSEGTSPFRSIGLQNPYAKIQSFGFDPVNDDIYMVQTTGAEYDGNSMAYHTCHGDLTITKTNLSGTASSHMYLNGCGHGISIGVQSKGANTEPWLWMECNCSVTASGVATYGNELFRFVWSPNSTINFSSSTAYQYNLKPGSNSNSCNIDISYNNLILRYHNHGAKYSIYDLTDVYNNASATPWIEFDQPAIVNSLSSAFQGYALYGEYLYMLNGDSEPGGTCPGTEAIGNSYPITLTAMNVTTGATWQSNSNAGYSIGEREPEGMAIYLNSSLTRSSAKLCFGLAGYNDSCPNPQTWAASIYYKGTQV